MTKEIKELIDETKRVLDNCTHPECIERRKRHGYSSCAGGHLARDLVKALRKKARQK
jgi:hypothetical protein